MTPRRAEPRSAEGVASEARLPNNALEQTAGSHSLAAGLLTARGRWAAERRLTDRPPGDDRLSDRQKIHGQNRED